MNSQHIHLNPAFSAAPGAIVTLQKKLRRLTEILGQILVTGHKVQSVLQFNAHLQQDIGERDEREFQSTQGRDAAANHARSFAAMLDRRI